MNTKIFSLLLVILIFCGCRQRNENLKLNFKIEKLVVVNLQEVCVTYFKFKIENPNNFNVVLLDSIFESEEKGFYLKNDNKVIPLSFYGNKYLTIPPKSNNYYFLGAKDLDYSYRQGDSLKLKKIVSEFSLKYSGLDLDVIRINDIDEKDYVKFKDTLSLQLKVDTLEIKYLDKNPIYRTEWDKL